MVPDHVFEIPLIIDFSECHSEADDDLAVSEALLAFTDEDLNELSDVRLDELARVLIKGSKGGPSSVDCRSELDWIAICTIGIGTIGPEPIVFAVEGMVLGLEARRNLYTNLLARELGVRRLAGKA